jgi:hypothetical protein
VSGDRPSPVSFPVRVLQFLWGVLGQIVARGVVWVLAALHLCRRRLRRKSVPAHDEPTRRRIRRRLSQMLLHRISWRLLALMAGLIVLVGAAFVTGCLLTCIGAAAYFLRGD